ncbi:uncharacterized protein [Amphiura filiformis]|uniref:uncharacterized protein n=1 Tax=Amphiura filiformis TaxID=82378 RepID=UPI003B22101F
MCGLGAEEVEVTLVIINDETEAEMAKLLIANEEDEYYWIGARYYDKDKLYWLDGTIIITNDTTDTFYTNFTTEGIRTPNHDCVAMSSKGTWIYDDCSTLRLSICESLGIFA